MHEKVAYRDIILEHISTSIQSADIFTKEHMAVWTRIFHMRPHSIGETRFLFVKK